MLNATGRRAVAIALAALCGHAAHARVLEVGEGKAYPAPSAAARDARDGDTVAIAPGSYYDCATWHADRLVIAGTAPDTVISDSACAGKAAFVITGSGVTVRGLTFTRIRVPDGNGAGIRMEGPDLAVEDSQFVNNQAGVLAGDTGGSLRITNCRFSRNGVSPDLRPTHAVLAGRLDLLRIERSEFAGARGGNHVTSFARRTELFGNRLADDGGGMTGPMVSVTGGAVAIDGNTFVLDAHAAERAGAVLVFGSADSITVRRNTLAEPEGGVPMVRNWTGTRASEDANVVPPNAAAVSDEGTAYHQLRARLAVLRDDARAAAAAARHGLGEVARGLHLIQ